MIDAIVAEESLLLSRMCWFNVTKRVLNILDQADYFQDIDALVSSGVKAMDVNDHTHIFVIARDDLELVALLRG